MSSQAVLAAKPRSDHHVAKWLKPCSPSNCSACCVPPISFGTTMAATTASSVKKTAANLLVQLRSFLSEVRSSFGQAWESYQLLLPTNRSEWTGQHHEVVVNLLQGVNTPSSRRVANCVSH